MKSLQKPKGTVIKTVLSMRGRYISKGRNILVEAILAQMEKFYGFKSALGKFYNA